MMGSPVEDEKKEGFSSAKAAAHTTEKMLAVVLTLVFYVGVVMLVAFLGASLWNSTLVPAVAGVKEVTSLQLLGIYFLVRFFLM
jgi:hypothetical protein